MLTLLAFLKRRADLSPAAFRDYYDNHHVPLVLGFTAPPLVYKRNYLRRDDLLLDGGDKIQFDVVVEQVFSDRAAFERWIGDLSAPGVGEQIKADEARFLDHAQYFAYLVDQDVTTEPATPAKTWSRQPEG